MGKAKRSLEEKRFTPGPGAYKGNVNAIRRKGPSYVLGLKTKPDFSYLNKGPGPGQYSVKQSRTSGGFSFGGRNSLGLTDKTPGPGSYLMGSTLNRKGKSFGKEKKRSLVSRNGVPGPGQYPIRGHSTKGSSPKYGFGT